MRCLKCLDSGWVCEDHEYMPSDVVSEGGCTCGGAAVPCECNPTAEYNGWAKIYAEVDVPSA
jgi:hypothetical protein